MNINNEASSPMREELEVRRPDILMVGGDRGVRGAREELLVSTLKLLVKP